MPCESCASCLIFFSLRGRQVALGPLHVSHLLQTAFLTTCRINIEGFEAVLSRYEAKLLSTITFTAVSSLKKEGGKSLAVSPLARFIRFTLAR